MTTRLVADFILCVSVLFLPWWFTLLLGAMFFFIFDRFYELLAAALLTDLLYGVPLPRFAGFPFILSSGAVILYLALAAFKGKMRVS